MFGLPPSFLERLNCLIKLSGGDQEIEISAQPRPWRGIYPLSEARAFERDSHHSQFLQPLHYFGQYMKLMLVPHSRRGFVGSIGLADIVIVQSTSRICGH